MTRPAGPGSSRPSGCQRNRRRLGYGLAIELVLALALACLGGAFQPVASQSILAASASLGGNTFTAGSWALYLHNVPAGTTTAQFNLPLNTTAPTPTTLANYDTNCDSSAGRLLTTGTALSSESRTCYYANWRTTTYAAMRPLNGTITLRMWAAKSASGGTNPTLKAYLRDYDPVATTYVDLGSATATSTSTTQTQLVLTWTLASSVAAGHQLELKLVASGSSANLIVAYDTTTYLSRLILLQQPAS